jgi:LCP family protein required for cell wall assembly
MSPKQTELHRPRHSLRPKTRSLATKKIIKTILTTVTVLAVSGITVAAYAINSLQEVVETNTFELKEPIPDAVNLEKKTIDGAFNILLVGSDTREGQNYQDDVEGELNDVNMLVKVNKEHNRIDVVSFPRDLVVDIACVNSYGNPVGEDMINTALRHGGMPCVSETITALTGQEVNYAALVNFNSVETLTDAIDGVPLCFTENVYDRMENNGNILFNEGQNNLSGAGALRFLRERKSFGDGGDLGRVANQQLFVKAFLQKVSKENLILNPVKVYQLSNIALQNLQLSSNMSSPAMLITLANTFNNMPLNEARVHTIPNLPNPKNVNRLIPDYAQLPGFFAEMDVPVILAPAEAVSSSGTGGALQVEAPPVEPAPLEVAPSGEVSVVQLCS